MAGGPCPHCGARIELAPALFARERRCEACAGAYVAVLPEDADATIEGDVVLLPIGRERKIGQWLDRKRLRTPALALLASVLGALVLVLALGALTWAFPALAPLFLMAVSALTLAAMSIAALAALALVAALVLFALSRGRVRDRAAFSRSVLALACGALVLMCLQTWLPRAASWLGGQGWPVAVACAVLAGAAAGGLVARLAPSRPYTHALAVAFGSTFLWLAPALIFLAFYEGRVTHSLATSAWYLPALCAGAWLGARLAAPAAPPPSPA